MGKIYLDSMFCHIMNAKLYFCVCFEIVVGSSDKPICPGPSRKVKEHYWNRNHAKIEIQFAADIIIELFGIIPKWGHYGSYHECIRVCYFWQYHRLTLIKGVYSFRYFLLPMGISNLLKHVFILPNSLGIMNTCISRFGIRIGRRKYLNEYTPFISVKLWYRKTLQRINLSQNNNIDMFLLL